MQRKLDNRPVSVKALRVRAGEEPQDFTKEFVGWSKKDGNRWEDPYEKRLRLAREKAQQEIDDAADTCPAEGSREGGNGKEEEEESAELEKIGWNYSKEGSGGSIQGSSVPVKNIIKLTAERNGGKPPPVSALRNGEIILRNAKQIPIPGGKVAIPALSLGAIPKIHEASTLDSARRRANAAQKAVGGEAADYADPETERFTLDEIQKGNTPRALNPACKELYLKDEEFALIFKKTDGKGMTKEEFWKQPFWKQRDAKKRAGLF